MTARSLTSAEVPIARRALTSRPAASEPMAAANDPARLYQPKTRVRSLFGKMWLSDACSTAMKGPTSPPLTLITPIVAATSSTQKFPDTAKNHAGCGHEPGTDPQHAASSHRVGVRREPEADRGVAEERQCQQQSDAQVAETKATSTGRG